MSKHTHKVLVVCAAVLTVSVLVCAGHGVEQRLAELEMLCKQKEEERVELELKLTEVKENLKKSLARGALGPPTDTKIIVKVSSYNLSSPASAAYTCNVPQNGVFTVFL